MEEAIENWMIRRIQEQSKLCLKRVKELDPAPQLDALGHGEAKMFTGSIYGAVPAGRFNTGADRPLSPGAFRR